MPHSNYSGTAVSATPVTQTELASLLRLQTFTANLAIRIRDRIRAGAPVERGPLVASVDPVVEEGEVDLASLYTEGLDIDYARRKRAAA